jgi:hypothetical protein
MTHPTPQEPPPRPHASRGRPALREPPPWPLQLSATWESSAAPGYVAPHETTPISIERLLCPTNKNITYIK